MGGWRFRNSLESTQVSHQYISAQHSSTTHRHPRLLEYRLTWILDTLRRTDYTRLERSGEAYVDYMGGALYPESLIRAHADFLNRSIMGNTHSVSNRYMRLLPVHPTQLTCHQALPYRSRAQMKPVLLFSRISMQLRTIPSYSRPTQVQLLSLLQKRTLLLAPVASSSGQILTTA
jgi:hypothetical protein